LLLVAAAMLVAADKPKALHVGDKVPDFTVTDLNGKTWKLSQLHEKAGLKKRVPIVLTFWCSFCHSCRHVEGSLDELATEYSGKAAIFALDASAENELDVTVLMNSEGNTADLFGTKFTTTTVVIDADGVLRYCGQFEHGKQSYAKNALAAVLDNKEVVTKTTPHRG
jgi:thiol-disulfide isomerase/thioredoxin